MGIRNIEELIEPTSDADRFAAMPPLSRAQVAKALAELPPIPDRDDESHIERGRE